MDARTPPELDLPLILDTSSLHKTPLVRRWLVQHPRVHLPFPPTSSSWLHLVECGFSLRQRHELARGQCGSTAALDQASTGYIAATNAAPKPFAWTKPADAILASVARYCQRITDSHH